MTGLAALIVAVITFWTTARISGLEDYLRSEISRRNSDLSSLSAKTALAEKLANEQASRLGAIQAATAEITSSSLAAQGRLVSAQGDLSRVRADVTDARQQLSLAQAATTSLRLDYSRQSRAFELFQRQQAYQIAAGQIVTGVGVFREGPPLGTAAIEEIQSLRAPVGQASLSPYLQIIRENIQRVCPRLKDWKPTLPERLAKPSEDRLLADLEKYHASESAYGEASIEEMKRLWDVASNCACSTLTTSEFGLSEICPGPRLQ